MAKNRRIPKRRSVVMTNTMRVGAVLGMLFVMSIINLLASSRCPQLLKAIGDSFVYRIKCAELPDFVRGGMNE